MIKLFVGFALGALFVYLFPEQGAVFVETGMAWLDATKDFVREWWDTNVTPRLA